MGWILLSAVLSLIAKEMGSNVPPSEFTTFESLIDIHVPISSTIFKSTSHSNLPTKEASNSAISHATTMDNYTMSFNCTCVHTTLCDDDDYFDKLRDPDVEWPKCENIVHYCCKNVSEPSPEPKPTTAPHLLPYLSSCGYRNISINESAARAGVAQFGELPWMVALLRMGSDGETDYLCGGSLIHPRVVMTGAHCVSGCHNQWPNVSGSKKKVNHQDLSAVKINHFLNRENLFIRAGEWDTQSTQEAHPTQDRNVTKVVIHEEYVKASLYNDIALLILESPLDIKADEGHVGLVCLPKYNENFDGRNCVASGWGKDKYGKKGRYQTLLKKVNLPVVPRDDCEKSLQKTRLGSYFKLHSSFICAGGKPDIDTCQGDGGSPLVCLGKQNPDMFVQAGIVAWGIGCGSRGPPAAYVKVAAFVPWINEKLQKHLTPL